MSFWRLMVYALYVFAGLVIVFLLLPKVFAAKPRVARKRPETLDTWKSEDRLGAT